MLSLHFASHSAHTESNTGRVLLAGTSSVTAQSFDLSAFLGLLPDTAIQQIAWVRNQLQLESWTSELVKRVYVANTRSLDTEKHNVRTSWLRPWLSARDLSSHLQSHYQTSESTAALHRICRRKNNPLFLK